MAHARDSNLPPVPRSDAAFADVAAPAPPQRVRVEYARPMVRADLAPEPDPAARNWALAAHLASLAGFVLPFPFASVAGPLVVWLGKRGEFAYVDEQGKESVNFQLTLAVWSVVGWATVCFFGLGFLVLLAAYGLGLVFLIVAAVRAANGEHWRYPLTFRFVR